MEDTQAEMVEEEEQSQQLTAASIFASYVSADTFEIVLAKGERLVCRMPKDASGVTEIEKRAQKLLKITQTTPHKIWKPYLPISPETARMICYLNLLIAPKFTQLDGLRLAKECAPVLLHIYNEIMAKIGGAVGKAEKEATDDFLDDSGEMSAGETI